MRELGRGEEGGIGMSRRKGRKEEIKGEGDLSKICGWILSTGNVILGTV